MTESMYCYTLNERLARIAAKYKSNNPAETNPQDGIPPAFINDYAVRVATSKNTASSNGPDDIIDVINDDRGPLLYIINNVTKDYEKIAFKSKPCMSPPTMAAYNLALVHSLALLNDDENVRTIRSLHSQQFINDRELNRILDIIRNLEVPPFMFDLLKGLSSTTMPQKPELKCVFNYSCFDYTFDKGRKFPINIFFIAHHLIASKTANTPIKDVLEEWYQSHVCTTPPSTVCQYFGLNPNNIYDTNWLSEPIQQLFNPVTNRAHTVRPLMNTINTQSQEYEDGTADNLNPYQYLLCLDTNNRDIVAPILESLSLSHKEHYPGCIKLGALQRDASGAQLLNHYYSNVLKPTWHDITISSNPKENEKFALSKLKYKQKVVKKPHRTLIIRPNDPPHEEALYLVEDIDYNPTLDPIKFEVENKHYPTIDRLRHFCPVDPHPECIYLNIITGKVIETAELDSVAVPQPNPRNTIDRENCYFLESALPLPSIQPPVSSNITDYNIAHRTRHSPSIPNVRIDLLDRSTNRIPRFGPNISAPMPERLPGFSYKSHIMDPAFACNSLSYILSPDSTTTAPSDNQRKPPAWSSYRYYSKKHPSETKHRDHIYMILNFRTLFGTNVLVQETSHISKCIPIS